MKYDMMEAIQKSTEQETKCQVLNGSVDAHLNTQYYQLHWSKNFYSSESWTLLSHSLHSEI